MSNQSPTANSKGQIPEPPFDRQPEPPFDRQQDKDWSPAQHESGTTGKPDDPKERQKRGNRGPDEQKGFGQGA